MVSGIARGNTHSNNDIAQHGSHTPANRLTEACWLGLQSIDICQIKVSADQYHMTILHAQA